MKAAKLIVSVAVSMSLFSNHVIADAVFKCSVGDKTVYQQAPCTGESKSVDLVNATAPTEKDRLEAENRAARTKAELKQKGGAAKPKPNEKPRNPGMTCFQNGPFMDCY